MSFVKSFAIFRVIHGQNDLLTPFELKAHNRRVYGGRSTYQNGTLEKNYGLEPEKMT